MLPTFRPQGRCITEDGYIEICVSFVIQRKNVKYCILNIYGLKYTIKIEKKKIVINSIVYTVTRQYLRCADTSFRGVLLCVCDLQTSTMR